MSELAMHASADPDAAIAEPAEPAAPAEPWTRENLITFAVGPTNCGKGKLTYDWWTSKAPRVLTLDTAGETLERNKNAIPANCLADCLDAMKYCAKNGDRWHIAAMLELEEIDQLFDRYLAPRFTGEDEQLIFPRLVGGMAVDCGEVYDIAPNSGAPKSILRALRMGRHYMLSSFFCAQRPASCARDCTAQAHDVAMFTTIEPRDKKFLADLCGRFLEDLLPELPQYHFAYFRKTENRIYVCDERRRVYSRFDTNGNRQ